MSEGARRASVRFGVFELDPTSGELLKRGVRLRLRDKPLQVLLALLDRPGQVVTRQELQDRLWPGGTFVEFENGLNNAMSRLRDALGDSADSPRYIETLPRRGYRFIAPVESPDSVGPDPAAVRSERAATPSASPDAPSAARSRWRWKPVAWLGLALIVVLGAVFLRRQPTRAPAHAVAVLPFVSGNPSEGSPDDYLAFGMTDALISELSRIGALKVISQTSVLQYRGRRATLPVIARELGVGTVVEGSVIHESGTVRVTVQLIDAATDTHLWSQTYNRDPATALSEQRVLAREVAGLIRSRLVPSDRTPAPAFHQTSAAASEAYLKGRYFLQRPGAGHLLRARQFFEQSIVADPEFALAHVGLSHYFLGTDAVAPAEAMARARSSALRAIELDASLAGAHAALAFIHYFGDWDWPAAEREFASALELDPNDAGTRRWHALFLSSMGRHETAAEEVRRALELDPVSISALDAAGAVYSNARRFDQTLEHARRIGELSADDPRALMHFALASIYQDRLPEALSWAEKGVAASGRDAAFLCVLAVAQHRAGRTAEAQETLREIDRLAENAYVPGVFLAVTYMWLRGHDAALARLQQAFDRRDTYMVVGKVAPMFDPLRGDPRFQDLLRRMNFPQ